RGDLVGLDLDHAAALALGGLPAAGLEPADHHGPVAFGQGLGDVLGELPPDVDAEEAGVAVAPAVAVADPGGDGQAEVGHQVAVAGVLELGVVGQVAGQGDVGVGHS